MPTASSFLRFLRDVPPYLRDRLTIDEAKRITRDRIARREDSFLSLMKTAVFEYEQSPYLWLFRQARCELGDLERMVRSGGLEKALEEIRAAGVYLTFEEFKGRKPVERSGRSITLTPFDTAMPGDRGGFTGTSGGSTGAGQPFSVTIDSLEGQWPPRMCLDEVLGILEAPVGQWFELLPAPVGVIVLLGRLKLGFDVQRWFYPPIDRGALGNLRARAAVGMIRAAARLGGASVPSLESARLDEVEKVLRWIHGVLSARGQLVFTCTASRAVRLATEAKRTGVDLTGCVFDVGGEPITNAKAQEITSSGARFTSSYYLGEAGLVGLGCGNPEGPNDVHVCADRFAVITAPREHGDETYDELFLTCLDETSPKLMLNLGSDDFGTVDERQCGCGLTELGMPLHVRDIYSFSKLTGEGVSLLGTDLVRILEHDLPARFGGTAMDYQLQEVEGEATGALDLVIDPSVSLPSEDEAVSFVLDALGTSGQAEDIRALWSQAGTVRVRRVKPFATGRGKQFPIVSFRAQRRPTGG